MTTTERALLIGVARLLAELVFWKNIDGREDAKRLLQLADAAEKDAAGVMLNPDQFGAWAAGEGYDIARTYDTERSRWVFLNPMTADLWKCWQAAHGVLVGDGTGDALPPVSQQERVAAGVRAHGGRVSDGG